MTHVFQAPMDRKLIKQLHKHESIKSILSLSGLSLKGIFSNCYLEIPKEYEPGLGWLIVWDPTVFAIKDEHLYCLAMGQSQSIPQTNQIWNGVCTVADCRLGSLGADPDL